MSGKRILPCRIDPSQCIVVDWVEAVKPWAWVRHFLSESCTNESLWPFTCNDRWLGAAHHSAGVDQNHTWVRNIPVVLHCTGWSAWRAFLPDRLPIISFWSLEPYGCWLQPTIRPAHAKPPHPTWVTAVRQIFRCYNQQGKLFFLRACFPQYVTVPVPDGIRDADVLGFSAESYTGLAIHEVLNEFDCFPDTTKVAAIVSPPEMLRLATGERRVVLLHCLEDRLCVWCPDTLTDLSYNVVLIDGHLSWSGRARHAYGHLLFTQLKKAPFI